jgi:hypothetical protein
MQATYLYISFTCFLQLWIWRREAPIKSNGYPTNLTKKRQGFQKRLIKYTFLQTHIPCSIPAHSEKSLVKCQRVHSSVPPASPPVHDSTQTCILKGRLIAESSQLLKPSSRSCQINFKTFVLPLSLLLVLKRFSLKLSEWTVLVNKGLFTRMRFHVQFACKSQMIFHIRTVEATADTKSYTKSHCDLDANRT